MQCPECGADVEPGSAYCTECGADISLPDRPEGGGDGVAAKIPGMKPGSTVRNVAVGVVIAIVVFGVLGAMVPGTDTPDDADLDGDDPGGAGDGDATETPSDPDDPTATDGGTDEAAAGTSEPAPSPTSESTAEPTATPRQEPETQSYSGNGQAVTDTVTIEGGLAVFELEHDGSSNFQVELVDRDSGETYEYLANEIGSWQARQPYYVPPGDYVLDVNADGAWSVDVAQPRPAPSEAEQPPATLSDEYPNYIGPIDFDGFHTISAAYSGDSNFAVWVLDEDGRRQDLIFNEVGEFEGENTYSGDHVGYVRIEATGDWELDVE